ncbi:MAG: HlyC/CorC family transporter [Clostridiales bacterium]|nr:HlyC/CorC family transporter [Clostridiales bacterium]
MMNGNAIKVIVLIVLIALSAFFSSAETALTTVNRMRIRSLVDEGNKRAKILTKVIDNQGKMLSAILIGNNIVNISASSLATVLAQDIYGNYAVSLATGILTIVILIFGEITPKTTASMNSEKIALLYARVVWTIMWILTPVIFIINILARGVMLLIGNDPNKHKNTITENELRTIVDVSHEEGVIQREEREMIKNVFDFGDAEAKEVMIPRIDMCMVDINAGYDELLELFKEFRYTRIPVFEESTDNVVGIINMKDLLFYEREGEFSIRNYLRPAFYTYEYKKLSELMLEMKKDSVNIIIVLDEYGASVGLITLEDLLEEIVGEIRDEYDYDEEDDIKLVSEDEFQVDGLIKLDDLNEKLKLKNKIESDEYESLGGFIMEQLDRLAKVGDIVETRELTLVVESMEKNRIDKVHVFRKELNEDIVDEN